MDYKYDTHVWPKVSCYGAGGFIGHWRLSDRYALRYLHNRKQDVEGHDKSDGQEYTNEDKTK